MLIKTDKQFTTEQMRSLMTSYLMAGLDENNAKIEFLALLGIKVHIDSLERIYNDVIHIINTQPIITITTTITAS